jgi:RNase P/RNase MRP subunit p30
VAREYADIYLKGLDGDCIAALVGYSYRLACVENLSNEFAEKARSLGLTVRRKQVLSPSSRSELLRCLHEIDEEVCVSVKPLSREALMTALRDRRVDTVMLHAGIAEVDRHILQVWENAVELAVSELVECAGNVKGLRTVIAYCRKAVDNDIPVAVSSGAASAEEILPPQQLAYVLAALTEMEAPVLDAVSTAPVTILKKERK